MLWNPQVKLFCKKNECARTHSGKVCHAQRCRCVRPVTFVKGGETYEKCFNGMFKLKKKEDN